MTGYRAPDSGAARLAPADRWRWQDRANCKGEDLNLFFAPEGERLHEREAREAKAKATCQACPLRTVCLDDALARNDYWGIRGGLTPDEIVAERRRRMRAGTLHATPTCANGHRRTEANAVYDGHGVRRCAPCRKASRPGAAA